MKEKRRITAPMTSKYNNDLKNPIITVPTALIIMRISKFNTKQYNTRIPVVRLMNRAIKIFIIIVSPMMK